MKPSSAIAITVCALIYAWTGTLRAAPGGTAVLATDATAQLLAEVGQTAKVGQTADVRKVDAKNSDEGFVSLFNGKDFSGWISMGKQEAWKIKNGKIRSDGDTGGFWLRSKKKYRNFIWKVDWKISKGGNSGVYLRSAKKDLPWETGYEVQISNDPRDDLHCTGSLYGHAAVNPRPDESPDKWHTFQMRCEDAHITVTCDGVKCVDFDQSKADISKHKPLVGYIGLQDAHGSQEHYVEYRNIKIKVLDKATP